MAKKQLNSDFIIIHRPLICDSRISDGAYRLYCYLADRRNSKFGGLVWVNQSTMAKDLDLSIPSIVKRLKELEEVGLVIPDKMEFWPESGERVIGRNKLQYKVLPTNEFYSPDELKKNWNSNTKKNIDTVSKKNEVSTNKKIEHINANIPLSSLIEQEIVKQNEEYQEQAQQTSCETESYNRDSIKIKEGIVVEPEIRAAMEFFTKTMKEKNRDDYPKQFNESDINIIRQALNRFGFKDTLRNIDYAVRCWDQIVKDYNKLQGTVFNLQTLSTRWHDVIQSARVKEANRRKYSFEDDIWVDPFA